jgi:hypothetical protein
VEVDAYDNDGGWGGEQDEAEDAVGTSVKDEPEEEEEEEDALFPKEVGILAECAMRNASTIALSLLALPAELPQPAATAASDTGIPVTWDSAAAATERRGRMIVARGDTGDVPLDDTVRGAEKDR